MDGANKGRKVNRQTAIGMCLCILGIGILLCAVISQLSGAAMASLLLLALPVVVGFGLIVTGFALMVAGAEPFDDESSGVRDGNDCDSAQDRRRE